MKRIIVGIFINEILAAIASAIMSFVIVHIYGSFGFGYKIFIFLFAALQLIIVIHAVEAGLVRKKQRSPEREDRLG